MIVGGELFISAIEGEPGRILDVGTGTGIWAIDIADQFPGSHVIGTDLSPIQPKWVPPNLHFYVDDAESEWTFEEPFDFVHGRALCGGIANWPAFYAQAFKSLKPGGWMEMQEHRGAFFSDDGGMERAKACVAVTEQLTKASDSMGKQLDVAHHQKQWMIDAGFVDVQEVIKKVRQSQKQQARWTYRTAGANWAMG
jgi:SAM-dependent methyltransferase